MTTKQTDYAPVKVDETTPSAIQTYKQAEQQEEAEVMAAVGHLAPLTQIDEPHRFKLPQLGIIHRGYKDERGNPKGTDYFVLPDELREDPAYREALEKLGEDPDKPRKLPFAFMANEPARNISTCFELYGTDAKLKYRWYDGDVNALVLDGVEYIERPFQEKDLQNGGQWITKLKVSLMDASGLGYYKLTTPSRNNRASLLTEMCQVLALVGHLARVDLLLVMDNSRTFHPKVTNRQGETRRIATSPYMLHIRAPFSMRKLLEQVGKSSAEQDFEEGSDLEDTTPTAEQIDPAAEAKRLEEERQNLLAAVLKLAKDKWDDPDDWKQARIDELGPDRGAIKTKELTAEELAQLLAAYTPTDEPPTPSGVIEGTVVTTVPADLEQGEAADIQAQLLTEIKDDIFALANELNVGLLVHIESVLNSALALEDLTMPQCEEVYGALSVIKQERQANAKGQESQEHKPQTCTDCTQNITPFQSQQSIQRYGKEVCRKCESGHVQGEHQKGETAGGPAFVEHAKSPTDDSSNAQRGMLAGLFKEKGFSEDEEDAWLEEHFKVRSKTKLNKSQASKAIELMQAEANRGPQTEALPLDDNPPAPSDDDFDPFKDE